MKRFVYRIELENKKRRNTVFLAGSNVTDVMNNLLQSKHTSTHAVSVTPVLENEQDPMSNEMILGN